MTNVASLLLTAQYLKAKMTEENQFRDSNRDLWIAPFSFYKTNNGLISLAIIGDQKFFSFCEHVLKDQTLALKYPKNEDRLKNIDEFEKALSEKLSKKTTEEWMKGCEKHPIPCSKVNTITEAIQQPFAKEIFDITTEGTTIIASPGNSSSYDREDAQKMRPAPKLDEHREAILALIQFSYRYENKHFHEIARDFLNLSENDTICVF